MAALVVLFIGGVYCTGYWFGAHAKHPNSLGTGIGITVAVAVLWFVIFLWRAAGDAGSESR